MKSAQACRRMLRRPVAHVVTPLVLTLTTALFANAAQAATIIDSFDGSLLNPSVWRGGWFTNDALEVRRRVTGGALYMSLHSLGDKTSNGGRTNVKSQVIPVDSIAGNLKRISMDIVPLRAAARHCANGDKDSRSRIGMTVVWMNDGSSTGPSDQTGNVGSFIELRANPGNGKDMEIKPSVWRCSNSTCSSRTELARTGTETLGRVHYGFSAGLLMRYNATNNAVEFVTTTPTGSYNQSAGVGAVSTIAPPVQPVAAIEARTEVDNCDLSVSGVRTPFAQISANILRVRMDTN